MINRFKLMKCYPGYKKTRAYLPSITRVQIELAPDWINTISTGVAPVQLVLNPNWSYRVCTLSVRIYKVILSIQLPRVRFPLVELPGVN